MLTLPPPALAPAPPAIVWHLTTLHRARGPNYWEPGERKKNHGWSKRDPRTEPPPPRARDLPPQSSTLPEVLPELGRATSGLGAGLSIPKSLKWIVSGGHGRNGPG